MSQEEAYHALTEAESLLDAADQNPDVARTSAQLALRALLLEWGEAPEAETVTGLLEQAARTDDTLLEFHAEAEVLDRFNPAPDAVERAKIFLDAARARMVNI